jgi:protein-serine/threonine kinase
MPSTKTPGGTGQFNQKLRNFFRINNGTPRESEKEKDTKPAHDPNANTNPNSKFRNGNFFRTTVGRLRTNTTASEGHPLDEALSPTAHANPYFAHQGQPGLRHHNAGSVPPSPPDTPTLKAESTHGGNGAESQTTNATREELARKLRRVASAPNAQGLFAKAKGSPNTERPATAELGKDPLVVHKDSGTLELVDSAKAAAMGSSSASSNPGSGQTDQDILAGLPAPNRTNLAFRRTYSSNSIKVRDVEVGPESFDKIKLIGKGDVGKVYLVQEKKSSRLYAMKGMSALPCPAWPCNVSSLDPVHR